MLGRRGVSLLANILALQILFPKSYSINKLSQLPWFINLRSIHEAIPRFWELLLNIKRWFRQKLHPSRVILDRGPRAAMFTSTVTTLGALLDSQPGNQLRLSDNKGGVLFLNGWQSFILELLHETFLEQTFLFYFWSVITFSLLPCHALAGLNGGNDSYFSTPAASPSNISSACTSMVWLLGNVFFLKSSHAIPHCDKLHKLLLPVF